MIFTFDGRQLCRDMLCRGLTAHDVAREGKLSVRTVRAAMDSRPVRVSSALLISKVLARTPVVIPDHLFLDLSGAPLLKTTDPGVSQPNSGPELPR